MANHKSAVKRTKQNKTKNEQNKAKRSEAKTWVKKIREAITAKDKTKALELLPEVQKVLAKLANTPASSKKTTARRTSRLAAQVAKL